MKRTVYCVIALLVTLSLIPVAKAVNDSAASYTLAKSKFGIATYTGLNDGASIETLTHNLFDKGMGDVFTSIASNSSRGFNFDSDFRYYNPGKILDLITHQMREPISLLLFGFAMIGFVRLRKKFKN